MLRNFQSKIRLYQGFNLLEIVVAVGVFMIIVTGFSLVSLDSIRGTRNNQDRTEAYQKLLETTQALSAHKSINWPDLITNTDASPKSLEVVDSKITLVDGIKNVDGFETWLEIYPIRRDSNGNVVESGGVVDPYSREVRLYVRWADVLNLDHVVTKSLILNDWNSSRSLITTSADFTPGTFDFTLVAPVGDGAIGLTTVFYPDWCNPSASITSHDIPGTATATTVVANENVAFLGTAGQANGVSVTKITVDGIDNPVITVNQEWDNYLVNNIFLRGDYAYLATTDDNKEVVILSVSSYPFVEVGTFNAGGSSDAYSVWVDARGVGYVAQGRKIETFDVGFTAGNPGTITANSGARTLLDSINVAWFIGQVSQIIVINNYIYASLNNDWYELGILNATNPSNVSITSQTSVNNQQVLDIYMSPDGNRAYFGTNSSSEREFFILNTSVKTGARPIIGSYDTNGMSVRGISVIPEDNRVVLVGNNGREYQALDITNEATPQFCGGMELNSGINDIDTYKDEFSNAFSYLMTGDTGAEFKILRGGKGGGWGNGYGYAEAGTYISPVYDTGSTATLYSYISWLETIPASTDIQIQVRSSQFSNMSGAIWMGPDGTGSTYYTDGYGGVPPQSLSNKRYFQFRAVLTGDTVESPVLEEFILYFHN